MTERARQPISEAFQKALVESLTNQRWDTALHRTVDELGLALASHPGLKRKRNEDRTAVAHIQLPDGDRYTLAVVCDGVGGSESGDKAATLAISAVILELCRVQTKVLLGGLVGRLVRVADDYVRSELKGRGTTTMAILVGTPDGQCVASNVGDSRVYAWLPEQHLTQISSDDTVENELKALPGNHEGLMQARGLRGRLSQAIGESGRASDELRVLTFSRAALPAGAVLGTDGLWKTSNDFLTVLSKAESPGEAARRVVQLANWCGGIDNASLIAISDLSKFCSFRTSYSMPSVLTATVWANESRLVFVHNGASGEASESKSKGPARSKRKTVKAVKGPQTREPELPLGDSESSTDGGRMGERANSGKIMDIKPLIEVTLNKAQPEK